MKWVLVVFVVLYGIAALLLAVGTYGLFGQERDPLSGIFLLPLGIPWNMIGERLGLSGVAIALLAPAINAAILLWLWRR